LEKTEPLTEEIISKSKSKPLYGELLEGEKILFYMHGYQVKTDVDKHSDISGGFGIETGGSMKEIHIKMNTLAYPSGFGEFINRHCFVRMGSETVPICIKREIM
jgi:hypothetical protein